MERPRGVKKTLTFWRKEKKCVRRGECQEEAQDERVRMKLESSWRLDCERQSNHIGELGLHPKTAGRSWKTFKAGVGQ